MKNIAKKWRKKNGLTNKGGVVIIFNDTAQSWVNELRTPQGLCPGCIAIDESGNEFISVGGNDYDGAEKWVSV